MIMGIISLIFIIIGFLLLFYGNDDGNLIWFTLGMVLCVVGLVGIFMFVGINMDTIKEWFRIR